MKNILFLVIVFQLLSSNFLCGQENLVVIPQKKIGVIDSLEKTLLWKITGKNKKKSSYLFGTIHIIPKDKFRISDQAQVAFDQSDILALEIDFDEKNIGMLFGLITKAFMEGGVTLKSLVDSTNYLLLEEHFNGLGLPMIFLNKVKPMFTSMLIDIDMQELQVGDDNTTGYELELMQLANHNEMEVLGLESLDFQMSLFDSIPYKLQADMLVEYIKDKNGNGNGDGFNVDQLIQLYLSEDIESMAQIATQTKQFSTIEYDMQELLLNKRNRSWIPKIQDIINSKQSAFIAVGAAHLGGEQGVIRLLRKEGIIVQPIFQTF